MERAEIEKSLEHRIDAVNLEFLTGKRQGKVRDIYLLDDERVLIIATDRLSGFDRILGLVPFKGQVLNQLAAYWFDKTRDIIPNHLCSIPDPNVTVARRCTPIPVEIVVRGYITGVTTTSLWYQYEQGERQIYGIQFPDGLAKNDALPAPVLTPTTKAAKGDHDERLTHAQVIERGLMSEELWAQTCSAALQLFQHGQKLAQEGGLILVDTKYEFGLNSRGELTLIDEIHTPDSSRFWLADTYAERHAQGNEPHNFDKEFVRLAYAALGYRGDGLPPPLADELAIQLAERYIRTYEMITGCTFEPGELPAQPRIARNISNWLAKQSA